MQSTLSLTQERNKWEAVTDIWKKKYEELLLEKVSLEESIETTVGLIETKHHDTVRSESDTPATWASSLHETHWRALQFVLSVSHAARLYCVRRDKS